VGHIANSSGAAATLLSLKSPKQIKNNQARAFQFGLVAWLEWQQPKSAGLFYLQFRVRGYASVDAQCTRHVACRIPSPPALWSLYVHYKTHWQLRTQMPLHYLARGTTSTILARMTRIACAFSFWQCISLFLLRSLFLSFFCFIRVVSCFFNKAKGGILVSVMLVSVSARAGSIYKVLCSYLIYSKSYPLCMKGIH
jgi:hypothetical protein